MTGVPHGRFVVVPASYVFLLRDPDDGASAEPEVLLQLRQGTGFMDGHWAAAAAGHVERGETAADAARREAVEELGIEVGDLTFVTAMQRTGGGEPIDERVDFFFLTREWSGEPSLQEPERSAGLRWCRLDRLDDLPAPVVPHERSVLASLRAGGPPPYSTFGFAPDTDAETS